MTRSGHTGGVSASPAERTRREAIQVGLAGLAAMGITALAPQRAFAAAGDTFILGGLNDSGVGASRLGSTSLNTTLEVSNTGTGTAGSALRCYNMGTDSEDPAVYCRTAGRGPALAAEINSATNGAPAVSAVNRGTGSAARGVFAVIESTNSTGCAIEGIVNSASGPGPSAIVARILAGGGEAVRVVHDGFGLGMSMQTQGDGIHVASGGYAVSAQATGAEDAVTARATGSASALFAEAYDSNNFSPAVKASTLGKGIALEAIAWNGENASSALVAATEGIGEALRAEVNNASNGSPAIAAKTVGTGCAIQAEGGRAQLYLKPAQTVGAPVDGSHQVGEVFVDSEGLFFSCTEAGTPGVWSLLSASGDATLDSDVTANTDTFALRSTQTGLGRSAEVHVNNALNKAPALLAKTTGTGPAIRAEATNALHVQGKMTMSRAGKAYIATGKASALVTVAGGGLTTASIILCTAQDSPGSGVFIRSAERISSTRFKIVLNKACSSSVKVGWMVLG